VLSLQDNGAEWFSIGTSMAMWKRHHVIGRLSWNTSFMPTTRYTSFSPSDQPGLMRLSASAANTLGRQLDLGNRLKANSWHCRIQHLPISSRNGDPTALPPPPRERSRNSPVCKIERAAAAAGGGWGSF